MIDGDTSRSETLSAEDAAALDWLEANEWSAADAPPELEPRITRIMQLFGRIEQGEPSSDDALLRSVYASLGLDDQPTREPRLGEQDADALDAWLLAGRRAERVPGVLRERARVHDTLATLLGASSTDHALDHGLTDRTLAVIAATDDAIEREPRRLGLSARLADFVSLAAVILIGASVLLPLMSSVRSESRRVANESNMAIAGLGFGAYAADHRDMLPRRSSPEPGAQFIWWRVGLDPSQSNSANVYTLHSLGYTPLQALASPGNPKARRQAASADAQDWESLQEVSYSYTLSRDAAVPLSDDAVILTDRSPVVARIAARQPVRIDENSPNHDGRGQHVLRGDGSVSWSDTPWTDSGDHMFLPREIEQIIDSLLRDRLLTFETLPSPNREADAFVAP